MELSLSAVESRVGPFRADIVAKRTDCDETVIIENQFGYTDHDHLGKLLTYTAGLGASGGAKTAIWIAGIFREEHRAALDWLNQRTDSDLNFYGVQLELWRIGGSLAAPRFHVVSRPNAPQKKLAQEASNLTETQRLYQRFWQAFIDYCGTDTKLVMGSAPAQHWLGTAIGRTGFGVNLTASKRDKKLECQLWVEGDSAKNAFANLLTRAQVISGTLGDQVIFDEMLGKKTCKVYETAFGDVSDEESWPGLHAWLKARGEAYVTVFRPLAQQL